MSCNKKHTPELGRGCCFCDCGDELDAIASEGCYKLHETNWLEEYPDNIPTDIFEVRFKNTGFHTFHCVARDHLIRRCELDLGKQGSTRGQGVHGE